MSTTFTIEHRFPSISLQKFIRYLNSPDLNELLKTELDFKERKLLEKSEDKNGDVSWKFLVQKAGDVPAPLSKFVGADGLGWVETSRFIAQDSCIYWRIEPQIKALKMTGEGKWLLSDHGKGCKRVIEGTIIVAIPLVGKVIENLIVKELERAYEKEPEVQKRFYATMP